VAYTAPAGGVKLSNVATGTLVAGVTLSKRLKMTYAADGFTTAGIVKNTVDGIFTGGNTIAASDLPVHSHTSATTGGDYAWADITTLPVPITQGGTGCANAVDLSALVNSYVSGGLHDAVTIADTYSVNMALTGQLLSADLIVQDTTSVDLAIDASGLKATVLPAGVDHNNLNNYSATYHFAQTAITNVSTALATGLLKVTTTTGALSVAVAGTDFIAPYASQTAKYFLAAPNASDGVPSFRAIVASDIPALNQDTTGDADSLLGSTWAAPAAIGSGTPAAGAFTTLSATGVITSTLATGTAPFTVASTTVVANLNVSQLLGGTWAIPGTIGSTTPNTIKGTTSTFSGEMTLSAASRHFNATGGDILDFNMNRTTTIDANRRFRFGRETTTGTGTLYTSWFVGDGTALEAMVLNHKTKELGVNTVIVVGIGGTTRGYILLQEGAGGNTPGYVKLDSANGTSVYVASAAAGHITSGTTLPSADGTNLFQTINPASPPTLTALSVTTSLNSASAAFALLATPVTITAFAASTSLTIGALTGVTVIRNAIVTYSTVAANLEIYSGVQGTNPGALILYNGSGTNEPAYIMLHSRSGAVRYLYLRDDGDFAIHTDVPDADTDGVVVGTQS
jgi:hypothetical protein